MSIFLIYLLLVFFFEKKNTNNLNNNRTEPIESGMNFWKICHNFSLFFNSKIRKFKLQYWIYYTELN